MTRPSSWVVAAALLVGGCATGPINAPISQADPRAGYRFETRQAESANGRENLVILAFSGGGTRAAAFSYGVLEYLRRTEDFFARHGSMTLVLARFVPIVRTCVPFVAGVARMPYARFQAYNVTGALIWVLLLVWAGFFFGNLPFIKNNFGLFTIGIVVVSVLPMVWAAFKK